MAKTKKPPKGKAPKKVVKKPTKRTKKTTSKSTPKTIKQPQKVTTSVAPKSNTPKKKENSLVQWLKSKLRIIGIIITAIALVGAFFYFGTNIYRDQSEATVPDYDEICAEYPNHEDPTCDYLCMYPDEYSFCTEEPDICETDPFADGCVCDSNPMDETCYEYCEEVDDPDCQEICNNDPFNSWCEDPCIGFPGPGCEEIDPCLFGPSPDCCELSQGEYPGCTEEPDPCDEGPNPSCCEFSGGEFPGCEEDEPELDITARVPSVTQSAFDILVEYVTKDYTNGIDGYSTIIFSKSGNSDVFTETLENSPARIRANDFDKNSEICAKAVQYGEEIQGSRRCKPFPEYTRPTLTLDSIAEEGEDIVVNFTTLRYTNGEFARTRFTMDPVGIQNFSGGEQPISYLNNYTGPSPFRFPKVEIPEGVAELCARARPANKDFTDVEPANANTVCIALPQTETPEEPDDEPESNAPVFLTVGTTQTLDSVVTLNQTIFQPGDTFQFVANNIRYEDGSPAANVDCQIEVIFTPADGSGQQTLIVNKKTDANGSCTLRVDSEGLISFNPMDLFSLNTFAQTLGVGDFTNLFNQPGTAVVRAYVFGDNGTRIETDAVTFSVNGTNFALIDTAGTSTMDVGSLARTGGFYSAAGYMVFLFIALSVAYYALERDF
jgi:hypothetical protein